MAERQHLRSSIVVVAACLVVTAAVFALDAARADDRYRSHVDFSMDVVLPSAHWDPEVAALAPDEAMAGAIAFAGSDRVRGSVETELTYDHSLDVEAVDDHVLRFTAEADDPALAVNAATAAAAIFGQQRVEVAQAEAREALPTLREQADAATGADAEVAQGRLGAAEDTVELGPAGGPVAEAAVPCCPVARPVLPATGRGALLGLLLGLAVVGVWWFERTRAPALAGGPTRAPATVGAPVGEGNGATATDESGTTESVTIGPDESPQPGGDAPPPALPWRWLGPAVVSALVAGRALYYAVLGPRLILDDWLLVYRHQELGLLHTVPEFTRTELPVKWAWLTTLFGLADGRPLVLFALVTLLNLAAALALYYALARFFPAPVPVLVAGLWVLTANHSALTVWAAASQGVVSLALCCVGVLLVSKGRWLVALLAFAASMLAYEFTIPICFAAAVLVGGTLAPPRPELPIVRSLRPWHRAVMVGGMGLVVWWIAEHPKYPVAWRPPSAWDTWAGHVSSGLLSTDDTSGLLLRALEVGVAVGIVCCLVAWWQGDRGRDRGPTLVLSGTAVMALGLVTTLLLPGDTVGLSNRLYGASAVGTAMVLTGIALTVWHRLRTVGLALAVSLVTLCVVGQVIGLRAAHRGGEDVLALLRHLERISDDPADTSFLVEPRPEHDGFYAVDHFFGVYPYRLTYPGGDGTLRLAIDTDEFEQPEPGEVQVRWDEVLGDDR
ncbi:MAG: hypothetical protein JNK12_04820 [Acidimicrobiales bacterium]|nr:hypothetical protein [Acidimicrobiales bacterium]